MEDLTTSMHELGIMAQKEAIAMRIITVVTVIFLPATFVSVSFIRPIQRQSSTPVC
jgi:Mg2+ and Co2+ transporter CorA